MVAFIHTADWQIGCPFGSFDERKRTLLREARSTVVDRIADVARNRGAAHILVAGDVFHSSTVADQLLRQTMARLGRHAPLTWHLLPGNHDPLRAGGVWERLARMGMPANVVVHSETKPHRLDDFTVLLPAPLSAAASSRDPTAWMDDAQTPPGVVRVGLAHGSIRGFGSDQQASQQIDPARVRSARLAYLALGDWHGTAGISERVWYSGTPEPDRFRENEPGYVLSVGLEAQRAGAADEQPPIRVERIRVAHFAWTQCEVVIDQLSDWERAAADVAAGAAAGVPVDRQLMRLVVRGALSLAERLRVEQSLAELEAGYFHLEADLDALHERAGDDDLSALSDDGVRAVAGRLREMADAGDEVARLALRKLIRLDLQVGGRSRGGVAGVDP